ncbi:pre-mRNA splicing factor prp17 [Capsaspora owczarzaki ATCC 30864]|uniref:Pre-mRNA-processing factor 17 n=1 Tax=Capsaspora owczarzaki (strain ATCC 30864) TaxID=595528 RepID=A0A0D2WQ23_CAPO3|nr:pre-mRNA splicing factor prp17 [Capsaspora owczarzaki ATCC 30864]KJE93650.1 pre-mRNA splicing factor prp17 [Capsaspora owczarzaki ATCC 30864]|eukprot:XP_004348234.2 pre-mRNA splicing factor prp17 [Capsaspora owczarzaki ATCC 30864]
MLALRSNYGSDSDESDGEQERSSASTSAPPASSSSSSSTPSSSSFSSSSAAVPLAVLPMLSTSALAPAVVSKREMLGQSAMSRLGAGDHEVYYNPRVDELYAAEQGPAKPGLTQQTAAQRNVLTGFVEDAEMSHFSFEQQRRTFNSFGYAANPSATAGNLSQANPLVVRQAQRETQARSIHKDLQKLLESTEDSGGLSAEVGPTSAMLLSNISPAVAAIKEQLAQQLANASHPDELPNVMDPGVRKKHADVRKKEDRGDIEANPTEYKGPWRKFVDQNESTKPTAEQAAVLEEYAKFRAANSRQRRKPGQDQQEEEAPATIDEKCTIHFQEVDYQGRNFMSAPRDLEVNLESSEPPEKCFMPKRIVYSWTGHTKGVNAIRFNPGSAHLILSCSMDSKIKLWEMYHKRRCIITYSGHEKAVRDVCFNNDGTKFLSASYDKYVKLWDTETGQCISRFTNKKVPYCVKFNPDEDKQHLFIAGCADRKIVTYDVNSGEVVQEYDRHLAAVNSITFIDENRRFVSTSDDKSIRVWDWDTPVDIKYIADPGMHSMPAVAVHPNKKWMLMQSMDNTINVYSTRDKFRAHKTKNFRGHLSAGYACQPDMSPDGSHVISGDGEGKLCIWDWKTCRLLKKMRGHDGACVGVLWHPHEKSKVVSCGWDGNIHLWD